MMGRWWLSLKSWARTVNRDDRIDAIIIGLLLVICWMVSGVPGVIFGLIGAKVARIPGVICTLGYFVALIMPADLAFSDTHQSFDFAAIWMYMLVTAAWIGALFIFKD